MQAQFVFQLSAATLVAKSAQTTMYLTIFASVQVARFVAALTVHPMWASGGIVLTAVCLAGIQLFGLAAMAAVWRRTSQAATSQPAAPTVTVIQEEDEAATAEETAA